MRNVTDEADKTVASNRRARHDYAIEERFEAGIELWGSEVKALREGNASLAQAYAAVRNGEAWLIGASIEPYRAATGQNHPPLRDRRLLLHRSEIDKIRRRTDERGLTLVALRLYFRAGKAKVELGLGRGRSTIDKRQQMASRDAQREIERAVRRSRT
jgi:SsrA-binding protein